MGAEAGCAFSCVSVKELAELSDLIYELYLKTHREEKEIVQSRWKGCECWY